eukprot:CAMPEP_0204380090 /NCGR_PEP_ID=MMETSP0469-20131031/53101_1 /ASSEMBLY_ACC=CAM_ASM_000384 /TAXON_ID=2969 /ORGANISM="Oxyrrhis marina" /LENGTH=74 /DNA_ID=CAMNT_0051371667 /DNA_START=16 /DNA_END=240 /DNA_ORIENTATION=-
MSDATMPRGTAQTPVLEELNREPLGKRESMRARTQVMIPLEGRSNPPHRNRPPPPSVRASEPCAGSTPEAGEKN